MTTNLFDLTGKIALITAAYQGLGFARDWVRSSMLTATFCESLEARKGL